MSVETKPALVMGAVFVAALVLCALLFYTCLGADTPPAKAPTPPPPPAKPTEFDLGVRAGAIRARMGVLETEYRQLEQALKEVEAQRAKPDAKTTPQKK